MAKMLRFDLRAPGLEGKELTTFYETCLEMCEWADELGFDGVSLSEHHGSADNYLPSTVVMASAIAARTKNLTINLWAVPAAFHDPLRLAEDLAVADIISGGRMSVAITGGYVPSEFDMFDRSIKERPQQVTEMIQTLEKAWTGEPFEFRGRTVQVLPRPVQRPRIPLLMGGASKPAARRAARIADGFIPSLPEFWDDYRAAMVEEGKEDPGPLPPRDQAFNYIAHDVDVAWDKIAPYCVHEMTSYAAWFAGSNAQSEYSDGTEEAAVVFTPEMVRGMGIYPVLTPEETIAECKRLGEFGLFTMHPLCGGTPPALAWESLRLFEQEVLPAL
jgi:alkanesulfonate monooxygenase SsuD/methylene tetrahydromethanopterin reductase-like flavin-dependent oxidoreductase (luciferase family)